jgi:hypothetical protein
MHLPRHLLPHHIANNKFLANFSHGRSVARQSLQFLAAEYTRAVQQAVYTRTTSVVNFATHLLAEA